MSRYSLWEKEAFDWHYDLIVIGAGITGLSTAHFYKKKHPNASVLVLERGAIPQGASTRNAGFACIGSISEHQADLERTSEQEVRQRICRRYEGLKLLRQTLGEEAIGFEQCGGYELFRSPQRYQASSRHIPKFNSWLADLIGEEAVYSNDDLNGYPVIHNRLEGALHPGKMMRALIAKVQQAGVEIRWNATVSQVESGGEITLDDETIFQGDQVLVAANAFARKLVPSAKVVPARGFVMVTERIPDLPWKGTFHHDRGYVYFRNVGDRLLLGGARNIAEDEEETDHFGTNPKIRNYLVDFATEILCLPGGWQIEHEWSGIMGFTPTKTPQLQQVENRLFIAAGLSGMGIAMGMRVGQEAAELLSEKAN